MGFQNLVLQSKQADIAVGLSAVNQNAVAGRRGDYAIALMAADRRLLWRAALFL
jgi:hypothetical protein